MLELTLTLNAEEALEGCGRRVLVIVSERQLAGRPGSRHWHLRIPARSGTLELTAWKGRSWVKVHPLREGEWAAGTARRLALMRRLQR